MGIIDRAVSNTYYMFLSWFSITFASFLFWFIFGKLLTPEEYGISLTTINFTIFVTGLIQIGLPGAIGKLVSEYAGVGNKRRIKEIISSALTVLLISSTVSTVVIFLLKDLIVSYLKIPQDALLPVFLAVFVIPLNSLFSQLFYGFQKMRRRFIGVFTFSLSKLIIAAIITLLGFSYLGPIVGTIVGFLSSLLILLDFRYVGFRLALDKELFNYASANFLSGFSFLLFANTQYLIVSLFRTSSTTGVFGVPMVIAVVMSVVPTLLSSGVFPIISELSVDKVFKEKQRRIIQSYLRYTILLTLPVFITLSIYSKEIIVFYSSEKYAGYNQLLPILSLGMFFLGLSSGLNSYINAIKKPHISRKIQLVVSGFYLTSASLLTMKYGGTGMAIAYTTSAFLYTTLCLVSLKRSMKVQLPLKPFLKMMISAAVSFSPLFIVRLYTSNLFIGLFVAALCSIGYFFVLLRLRFYTKDDLKIVMNVVRRFKILKFLIPILSKGIE